MEQNETATKWNETTKQNNETKWNERMKQNTTMKHQWNEMKLNKHESK